MKNENREEKLKEFVVALATICGIFNIPWFLVVATRGGIGNFLEGCVSLLMVAALLIRAVDEGSKITEDTSLSGNDKVLEKLLNAGVKDFRKKELGVELQVGDRVISFISGTIYTVVGVTEDTSYAAKKVMQYEIVEEISGDKKRLRQRKAKKNTIYSYFDFYRKLENKQE